MGVHIDKESVKTARYDEGRTINNGNGIHTHVRRSVYKSQYTRLTQKPRCHYSMKE